MGFGAESSGPGARNAWTWPASGSAALTGLGSRATGDITVVQFVAKEEGQRPGRGGGLTAPRGLTVLLILVRGECAFKGRDERLKPMRRHEVLVVEGGAPLELRPQAGARLAGLALPTNLIAPRFVGPERLAAASQQSHGVGMASLLYDLLSKLAARESATPGPGALVDAVGGLLSAMLEDCLPLERPARGEAAQARLDQINRYLRRHFADPELSAADAATAIGVSRRYLHRLYAHYDRSFRDELIALRIEACVKAFMDESQGTKTIAEIAFAAGYTDISQFNRHFRRLKGATPSEMRRSCPATSSEPSPGRPRLGRAA